MARGLKLLIKKFWTSFRQNLIAGVLVIMPVFMAIYVTEILYTWVDTPVQDSITNFLIGNDWTLTVEEKAKLEDSREIKVDKELFGWRTGLLITVRASMRPDGEINWKLFYGFGLITTVILVLIAGLLARTLFGKYFLRLSETVISKIPGIGTVYTATKQMGESLLSSSNKKFQDVVLAEWPRPGVYSIGFITGRASKLYDGMEEDSYFVFIPTAPNPTGGFLTVLAKKQMHILKVSVEDAVKLIISGGLIVPSKLGVSSIDLPSLKNAPANPPTGKNSPAVSAPPPGAAGG